MVTVAVVLRKEKLSKSNTAPINFRLIRNRKVRYIPSGISVHPHQWDDTNKLIKKGAANAGRLNAYLAKKYAEIHPFCIDEEIHSKKKVNVRKLKQKLTGDDEVDFIAFAEEFIQSYATTGQIGTYDKTKGIITKLKDYLQGKSFYFSDLTVDFLHRYQNYLKVTKKNKINTIHTNLKFIRRVFNAAFERDLVNYSDNPFLKFKLATEKTSRDFLSEEEVRRLEELKLRKNSSLERSRQAFVWACYAGGLRISDILLLKWTNYNNTHINFVIKKTRQQHSVKLPDKAIQILENLRWHGSLSKYIFGMLPANLDESNPYELDKAITRATVRHNSNLKKLAELANIEKSITSHVSRHTFATRALRKGITLDKVQHILRHQNPAVTQIYAKLINEDVDKAMDLFNE